MMSTSARGTPPLVRPRKVPKISISFFDFPLNVYVEIEWLNVEGFHVKNANEVRVIELGTHSISDG